MPNLFAYHMGHTFGDFEGRQYYTSKHAPNLMASGSNIYVISGYKGTKGIDFYLEGKFRLNNLESGRFELRSKTGEVKVFKRLLHLHPIARPPQRIRLDVTKGFDQTDMRNNFASVSPINPLRESYRERFDHLLIRFSILEEDDIDEDIKEIARRRDIIKTTKKQLIDARRGQGEFRSQVLRLWDGKCPITGIRLGAMLVASHIKPWRESSDEERLDPMNGIPFAAHIDKAFDRYLISFDEHGRILINNQHRLELEKLNITSLLQLDFMPLNFTQLGWVETYMHLHRGKFRACNK